MKTKLAEFLMIDEADLKGALLALIIAVPLSYVAFKIVMLPFGWWML